MRSPVAVGLRPSAPTEIRERVSLTNAQVGVPPRHAAMPSGRGALYLWPDGILFLGEKVRRERHRPFTASLVFALSENLRIRVGDEPGWLTTRGALVAPHTTQELRACCHLAILHIDPESEAYRRVAGRFARGPIYELPPAVVDALVDRTRALLGGPAFSPTRLWDLSLDLVGSPASEPGRLDQRVEQMLDLLKAEFLAAPTAARLAEAVGLSQRWLRHLFTEQLGIPPQRYVLWLRLRYAVYCWTLSRSLTAAAHAAGFADSAHLSRAFRHMFGIRPSSSFRANGRVGLVLGLPGERVGGPHVSSDPGFWAAAGAAHEPGAAPRAGDALRWRCIAMPRTQHIPADPTAAPLPWEWLPDLGEQREEARGH